VRIIKHFVYVKNAMKNIEFLFYVSLIWFLSQGLSWQLPADLVLHVLIIKSALRSSQVDQNRGRFDHCCLLPLTSCSSTATKQFKYANNVDSWPSFSFLFIYFFLSFKGLAFPLGIDVVEEENWIRFQWQLNNYNLEPLWSFHEIACFKSLRGNSTSTFIIFALSFSKLKNSQFRVSNFKKFTISSIR